MIFKLLFITILCLVSGLAYESTTISQSPTFANQFVQKCGARYLAENLSLKTSFSEDEVQVIFADLGKEPVSAETSPGFFGSLASYAQRGFDSAKQKLQKLPNVLTRQANAIGTRAKNLPNMLTKEASKASRKIGHLSRKVSDGVSDLMTTSQKETSPNALPVLKLKEAVEENIPENKTLKIEDNKTFQTKQPSVFEPTEMDQKTGVFENLKKSVKGISKATFANMNKIKRKISQTPNEVMSRFPSVKVIPNYISNAMGVKKSTSVLNHLSKRLKQIPQNITRILQGTAGALKNAINSKIQEVPNTLALYYQNFTSKVNASSLSRAKDMIGKRIQTLPDKLGKTFGYITNRTKKASYAVATKFTNLTNAISEGFTKFNQKVNTTTVAKAINMFTNKLFNVPAKIGRTITFVYDNAKNRASSFVTNGASFVKENMPRFADTVGSCFTWVKDGVKKFVFGSFRLVSKIWRFASFLGDYLYWGLIVVLGAIFLYIMSQVLPVFQFIWRILRAPWDILSLLIGIIKYLLPNKRRQETTPIIREKKNKNSKKYYSYYRCLACKKEWESSNTAESESQKCINDDCIQEAKPFSQIPLLSEKEKSWKQGEK